MLEKFFREHYRVVYGYLLSLCADPVEAEELAAAVFLKAVEHIEQYDPRFSPTTWLCTIGRNLYFNDRKRKRRLRPLENVGEGTAPSVETVYLQREAANEVTAAAWSLPLLQRQVFFMRLQGLSFREIGLALGKTENWARVTYYRVKQKILREMEGKV